MKKAAKAARGPRNTYESLYAYAKYADNIRNATGSIAADTAQCERVRVISHAEASRGRVLDIFVRVMRW